MRYYQCNHCLRALVDWKPVDVGPGNDFKPVDDSLAELHLILCCAQPDEEGNFDDKCFRCRAGGCDCVALDTAGCVAFESLANNYYDLWFGGSFELKKELWIQNRSLQDLRRRALHALDEAGKVARAPAQASVRVRAPVRAPPRIRFRTGRRIAYTAKQKVQPTKKSRAAKKFRATKKSKATMTSRITEKHQATDKSPATQKSQANTDTVLLARLASITTMQAQIDQVNLVEIMTRGMLHLVGASDHIQIPARTCPRALPNAAKKLLDDYNENVVEDRVEK